MNSTNTYYKNAEQLLQGRGISFSLTSDGTELRTLCPSCKHKNQKLYIENATGRYYCFHCGEHGGWKNLTQIMGDPSARIFETSGEEKEEEPDLPPIDLAIVEENHERLFTDGCTPVRQYLYKRGLNNNTLKKFKLGWDGKNIVIPIFDANGDCVNFKLKRDPTLPSGSKGMFSIRGYGRKRLFNERVLKEDPENVIVAEGEWDTMLLDQYGYTAVTSTAGAASFDKKWVDAFSKVKKIHIVFDNDRNGIGQAGAIKTAEMFANASIPVFIASLPDPKPTEDKVDVTDFFVKQNNTNKFPDLLQNAQPYQKEDDNSNETSSKQAIIQQLVELTINEGCKILLDSDKNTIIVFPDKPLVAFPLKGGAYRSWLSGKYYSLTKKGFSDNTFSNVTSILEGKAHHENVSITLHNRVAKVDNVIYYDLGNDKTVIRVDNDGWKETTECPVNFKRFKHQLAQITPTHGGKIQDVLQYINIYDTKEQLLFLTYLITVLIPNIPRTILVHIGDQGAAKSTGMKIARSLVDPSTTELLIPPSDIAELAQTANHHYCLYLDNLSHLSDQLSDVLCRLVTGAGFSKRKLYTDDEDIIFSLMAAVGITGITNVATKSDLLDRTLILRFKRISDEKRKDEEEFWKEFNDNKPQILGAIFTLLSKVLQIAPTLKLNKKPRMADYGKYATAAAIALGETQETFLAAFEENVQRQNNAAVESSPVAQVIIEFMRDKNDWSGSSSDLHGFLKTIAEKANLEIGGKDGFPKSSNWLWKRIQKVRPNLIALGIDATHGENDTGSYILLTKSINEKNAATTATETENIAKQNDTAINTATEDDTANKIEFAPAEFSVG